MAVNRWTVTNSMKSELVNSYWKYIISPVYKPPEYMPPKYVT